MDSESTEALEERAVDLVLGIGEDSSEEAQEEAQDEPQEAEEVEAEEGEEVEASEEGADDDSDDEPGPDDLVEFEFEGQLIEAPVAIKEALMRQADYTKKTQEISAKNKAIDVVQGDLEIRKKHYDFAQEAMPDIIKANQLDANVDELTRHLKANIDTLSNADTMKLQLAIEDAKKERDSLVQSLTAKQKEFQQAQEQTREELLNQGTEVLRGKFPNWGADAQKQVRDYALGTGFTEAEIANVVDPRQVEVLYKASLYDDLMAKGPSAVKKVQKAPRIASKSRNPMPKETQNKLNLRKKLKSDKLSRREKESAVIEDIGARWA